MSRTMLAVAILVMMAGTMTLAGPNQLKNEGVGTYSDASVGNQISNFSINRQMVS